MELDLTKEFKKEEVKHTDFFRRYSNVINDWLNTLVIPGKDINIFYGTGERIWSKIIRNRHNYSIDIPVISFFLTGRETDNQHYVPPEVMHNIAKNIVQAKPSFVKLKYQIIFWLKFLKEADTINYQINSMFSPELYLRARNKTMFALTGSDYWIDCRILEANDAIELEPGDKNDRVVKLEYTIEVDGKMPYVNQGYIAQPIHLIETNTYLDENLDKKINKIKDNIKDDEYLESITDYVRKMNHF